MTARRLAVLLCACDGGPHAGDPPAGSNVLIVLVDDVGTDRIGLYGAQRPAVTPVLDSLAATGLVFDNAWSLALCGPTRSALQTGLLPRRTGYGSNSQVFSPASAELDPAFTTIAELVETSPWFSYDSSYVGKWHLATFVGPSGSLGPKIQGWRWWTGTMSSPNNWFGPNPSGEAPNYFHFQQVDDAGEYVPTDAYATTVTADDAIGRLQTMTEPWLLQVAFNAAHGPLHVPPASLFHTPLSDSPTDPELHRALIEAMDTELGRLLDAMPAGVRERTMVFVLGDNGTPDHATEGDEDPARSKGSLYDGGIHVPFVVSGPLVATPGTRTDAFAHVIDLFPTIAAISGAEPPGPVDGISLLPVLADPATEVRTTLYVERFGPGGGGPFDTDERALRNDRYKLVVDALCGDEQFYEYVVGAVDEGPDLLEGGPLTVEQEEARVELRASIGDQVADLAYTSDTWTHVDPAPVICD